MTPATVNYSWNITYLHTSLCTFEANYITSISNAYRFNYLFWTRIWISDENGMDKDTIEETSNDRQSNMPYLPIFNRCLT